MARILVVDDSLDLLSIIKDFLIGLGHSCLLASSGREALDILSSDVFDLIISDYEMDFGDGLWLLGELQKNENSPRCIIMTANLTIKIDQFISAGASSLCFKPIEWGELEQEIQRLIPLN